MLNDPSTGPQTGGIGEIDDVNIRHRAGACEGTRAFLRCWPCTGPNLRSFYYTYRGAPPPAPKAHDHLFQPTTDLNFGCPPETLKIKFGRFWGAPWDPKITNKLQKCGSRTALAQTSQKTHYFGRSWAGRTLENQALV